MWKDQFLMSLDTAAAGLSAAGFSGHSLRSGFLIAAQAGASVWKMWEVSRHKSVQVLSGYIRSAASFDGHAGSGFLQLEVEDMQAGIGIRNTIRRPAPTASMRPGSGVGRLLRYARLIGSVWPRRCRARA